MYIYLNFIVSPKLLSENKVLRKKVKGALHIAYEGVNGDWWFLALIASPLTMNIRVPLDAAFVVAEADQAEGGGSARETQGDFSPVNMLFRPQMLGKCQVLRLLN